MASRPTLVTDTPADPPNGRTPAAAKTVGGKSIANQTTSRAITIHCDVAATVRWSLIGLAAIVIAATFLVVACRGGTNYPTTTGIAALGSLIGKSVDKPPARRPN